MILLERLLQEPWVRFGVTVIVALLLAVILRRLVWRLLERVGRRYPPWGELLHQASAPGEWVLPLLLLVVAVHTHPPASNHGLLDIVQHLLLIALIMAFTWLAIRCVGAVEGIFIRRFPLDTADNLRSRSLLTQAKVLSRTMIVLIVLLGGSGMLLTIPGVRQVGTSLLASAGVAGLAVGFAAKPVLSNLIAGIQIALTQPIRLDDVVIIEGEWGRIQEITGTYVVVHIWDDRRLVVPLNWFMENPFQNWTRTSSQLLGSVFLWVDYGMPLEPLRQELQRLCEQAPEWDKRVCLLQVTDTSDKAMQLRILVSTADSGRGWDLRCRIREGLLAFLQQHYPQSLPRLRGEFEATPAGSGPPPSPASA